MKRSKFSLGNTLQLSGRDRLPVNKSVQSVRCERRGGCPRSSSLGLGLGGPAMRTMRARAVKSRQSPHASVTKVP